ncbi:MAG: helix-turn-helix domain-containing protein [Acidobacteria bacterium]|nr:helix-turn-helix domain-containing protein [Acidobacteriota bacterium]
MAKGWSQTELADRLDTTLKMIDYYERRANNPSVEVCAPGCTRPGRLRG